MSSLLKIERELEERLAARARSVGQSLEEFVHAILEREAGADWPTASSGPTEAEAKLKAFRAWTEGFPADLPLLSLEDVSRESLYNKD